MREEENEREKKSKPQKAKRQGGGEEEIKTTQRKKKERNKINEFTKEKAMCLWSCHAKNEAGGKPWEVACLPRRRWFLRVLCSAGLAARPLGSFLLSQVLMLIVRTEGLRCVEG